MKRGIVIVIVALIAAACGAGGPPPLPTPPPATTPPGGTTSPTTAPPVTITPPVTVTPSVSIRPTPSSPGYEAWLELRGNLFIAIRQINASDAVEGAIKAMFRGPTKRESKLGIQTEVPKKAKVNGVTEHNALARVDLSHSFYTGKDHRSLSMRYAQVVYTASQFAAVNGVQFLENGKPKRVLNGDQTDQLHSANAKNYANLLPPILVQQPVIGEQVANPILVAGTTSVGTVSMRLLAPDGTLIASTTAPNACSGCRGTFTGNLTYYTKEKRGAVQVYEVGPTGTPINSVKVPVQLAP